MEDREILLDAIEAIKDHAESQEDGIKMGLYMSLAIIKGCVIEDNKIKELGLDEDFERKFFD